ncbi:cell cycle and apoptosis regulator protein 2 isoform X4 [Grus americana]|uniref:cell cycle and apoptosis regulator protein 2 isoform X4 n=1 Tax=Grus americana TaxID=9117 RepID=UPI002407C302|nr:cell cycle and apoptosis regulator protein 2 isoform X4 [Grus americana]
MLVKAACSPGLSPTSRASRSLSRDPGTAPTRATPGQQQSIPGAQRRFQPYRIPPLLPRKAVNLFPSPPSAQLRCPGQGQEQERLGQMSQGSQLCVPTPRARGPLAGEPTQGEPHRPRGSSLPPAPSAMPGRCYGSIRLPHGFYHLCLRWLAPSPPHPPPHWQYPSHIPGADREEDAEATLDDADSAFRFVLYRRLQ